MMLRTAFGGAGGTGDAADSGGDYTTHALVCKKLILLDLYLIVFSLEVQK